MLPKYTDITAIGFVLENDDILSVVAGCIERIGIPVYRLGLDDSEESIQELEIYIERDKPRIFALFGISDIQTRVKLGMLFETTVFYIESGLGSNRESCNGSTNKRTELSGMANDTIQVGLDGNVDIDVLRQEIKAKLHIYGIEVQEGRRGRYERE